MIEKSYPPQSSSAEYNERELYVCNVFMLKMQEANEVGR
jgi:hypothetical protein